MGFKTAKVGKCGMTEDNTVSIVLYKNRKFYCKQRGSYVTLRNIYDLYRNGARLLIQEYDSNKDITREIVFKSISLCGLNYETKIRLLSKMGERL